MISKVSSRTLRTVLVVTILIFSCPMVARSQCGGCGSDPAIRPGAWALQFRVADNFTLGSFEGTVVSAKYHFSGSRAIRFGIRGDVHSSNIDDKERQTHADSVIYDASQTRKYRQRSIGLSAEYLHYSAPRERMSLFVGAGPLFSYGWTSRYDHTPAYGDQDIRGHESRLGASALIGLEWFASRSISLHAEYGLSLSRSWSSGEVTTTTYAPPRRSQEKTTGRQWDLEGSSVLFGLSAYL